MLLGGDEQSTPVMIFAIPLSPIASGPQLKSETSWSLRLATVLFAKLTQPNLLATQLLREDRR